MSRVQIADFFVVLFFVSATVWNHCAFWASWSVVWLPSLYTLWVKFWFDLEEKVKKEQKFHSFVVRDGDTCWWQFAPRFSYKRSDWNQINVATLSTWSCSKYRCRTLLWRSNAWVSSQKMLQRFNEEMNNNDNIQCFTENTFQWNQDV